MSGRRLGLAACGRSLLCVAMVVLAGCATRTSLPTAPPLSAAAAAAQEAERQQWLAARPQWSLRGRLAVSQAGKGGSGRIDWQQQGERFEVSLSAPVTRQSWRLSGDATTAQLEGLEGGVREGGDAAALLHEATGWTVPVREMASWVRGLQADPAAAAPVSAWRDPQGRPQRIEQQGWRIDYLEWQTPENDLPALPRRIEARYGDAMLRLVVDAWSFNGP